MKNDTFFNILLLNVSCLNEIPKIAFFLFRYQGVEFLTEPEDLDPFSFVDIIWGLLSAGTFAFDVISEVVLAICMYWDPEARQWFLPTLLLTG